jgi:hypothetical protein
MVLLVLAALPAFVALILVTKSVFYTSARFTMFTFHPQKCNTYTSIRYLKVLNFIFFKQGHISNCPNSTRFYQYLAAGLLIFNYLKSYPQICSVIGTAKSGIYEVHTLIKKNPADASLWITVTASGLCIKESKASINLIRYLALTITTILL